MRRILGTESSLKLEKYKNKYGNFDIRKRVPKECIFVPEVWKDLIEDRKIPSIKVMQEFRQRTDSGKWFPVFSGYLVLKSDLGEIEDERECA